MLSRLGFTLHDATFKDAVLRQAGRDEILAALEQVEKALGD